MTDQSSLIVMQTLVVVMLYRRR